MFLISNSVKKIEEIKGINFSQSYISGPQFTFRGDLQNSIFTGLSGKGAGGVIQILEGNCDNCDFRNVDFNFMKLKAPGAPYPENSHSFKGAKFTDAFNFEFATKAEMLAYFGIANFSAETIWIDGTSILS